VDINITLLGQMITFAIFVWFTMKFVWPPIVKALRNRQEKIASGLAAAEQGEKALQKAQEQIVLQLQETKTEAGKILDQAHQRAVHIIEESKIQARQEGERLLKQAKEEIKREYTHAHQALTKQFGDMVVQCAKKVLGREVNVASNDILIDDLTEKL
jgi:F-type H+-transporting ATPase subunit b